MTFNEWAKKYTGEKIDYDKAYGVQCVDLIKHYVKNVLGIEPQAIGNAIEYYNKRKTSKYITDNFTVYDFKKGFAFKKGDIIVMKGKSEYGHIAVCNGEYNDEGVYAYDENGNGSGDGMTLRFFEYDGYYKLLCILRPKAQAKIGAADKTYFGVDISEHNGTVDWTELAKHIDFAVLRIGWVGNGKYKMDTEFAKNYEAAKKAGVKLGAYVYMYSKTAENAEVGADWILSQIKGKYFEMPIYCDMEDESIAGLGKKTLSAIATAFCDEIKKGGYAVGIYANKYWFTEKLNKNLQTKYHTWIAHYTSGTEKYKGEFEMWQNSSTGHVDGVKGNVDTNYLYKNIFTKAPVEPEKPAEKKPYSNGAESFDSAYKNGKQFTVSAASSLWLRKAPVDGKTIIAMPHGAKVMWFGYYTKVKNVIWRYVQYKHNGKTYEGFCSGKYLK
jgi:GH25 family lysozyme M1 (1,4-beta-N-acetylmuramidase)